MKSRIFAFLLAAITFLTCLITFNLSPSTGAVKAVNYGYINKKGKLVIESQFSEVKKFSQELAAVKLDDKWGYINKLGKLVIEPQFSDTGSFSQGLAAVKIGNKWGYVNATGKAVVKPQFSQAYTFSEGVAAVTVDDNKWEYIDKTGRRAIRLQLRLQLGSGFERYDGNREPGFFSEGLTAVIVNKNDRNMYSGYINKRGQVVIKTKFSEVDNFSEGLAAVEAGDGICGVRAEQCAYGYIDKIGKMVIGARFNNAEKFSQGLAAVATYGNSDGANAYGYYFDKWGYINKRGQLVTKPEFSTANNFSEGLAAVEVGRIRNNSDKNGIPTGDIGGKWGYIDGTGKQIIPLQFDLANSFSEGLAAVNVKNKCGYINKIGQIVVQPQFSFCEDFAEGLAAIKISVK